MDALWAGLSLLEKLFVACAAIGAVFFTFQVVMTLTGLGADADLADAPTDIHGGGDTHGHSSADLSFKVLSLQGITTMLMMLGIVGLALSRSTGGNAVISIAGGLVAGIGAAFVFDRIYKGFARLQHSGTVQLKNAVGQEATVYLTIPSGGTGQVQVVVQGRLRVAEARSNAAQPIETEKRVQVVGMAGEHVLLVEPKG